MVRRFFLLVRTHRWKSLLVLTVVVAGLVGGAYGYGLYQWQAARQAVAQGRAAEARERLEVCLLLWPRSVAVQLLVARTARLTGDFEEAEARLNRCMKLQEGASEATQLEFLLMRAHTGEVDEVAPLLLEYVKRKHADSPLILETVARVYMHQFRYGPAHAVLTRWIREAPETAKAFHWRGWILERVNSPEDAMKDYQRALELDPELVPVRLRMAEMLLEKHQPLEALPHLERLSADFPDRADVMARLGQCRYLQGRGQEARRLLEAAVKELPHDSVLLLHLGKLELQDGRPGRAEKWLRRALKADPGDTESQYQLVSALQLQGRTAEAAHTLAGYQKDKALLERANKLLREEAEHPGTDPAVPSEIGAALLRIGKEREAIYWLDQALLRDPAHDATHRILADYYERTGQPQKAALHRRRLTRKGSS